MLLNETLMVLAYTANMMATLPEKNNSVGNVSTTTLSPEEEENKFGLDDRKCRDSIFVGSACYLNQFYGV